MLAIVTPEDLDRVVDVCRRWEVRASVVGRVTDAPDGAAGRLRIMDGFDGEVLGDVPAVALSEDAPLYHRPISRPADHDARLADDPGRLEAPADCGIDLLELLTDPSWVYRQYDHHLFLNTVEGPGGDAAVLRLAAPGLPPSERGLALSTDSNPGWCSLDPRQGTAATVAEASLNVACAGARPMAVVNCLNFGNPEHPEVMWQLSEAIDGMTEACLALGLPVIGGNVSLYNESGGTDIDPTAVIGVIGLIDRLKVRPPGVSLVEGGTLVLLDGRPDVSGHPPLSLGGSRWARQLRGHRNGTLPPLDLAAHARLLSLVTGLVGDGVGGGKGLVSGIHDVSGGGLGVALAELAVRSGIGIVVNGEVGIPSHHQLFGEAPSRVVVCTTDAPALAAKAAASGVGCSVLGTAVGDRIVIDGLVDVGVIEAASAWRDRLPDLLDGFVPATSD